MWGTEGGSDGQIDGRGGGRPVQLEGRGKRQWGQWGQVGCRLGPYLVLTVDLGSRVNQDLKNL